VSDPLESLDRWLAMGGEERREEVQRLLDAGVIGEETAEILLSREAVRGLVSALVNLRGGEEQPWEPLEEDVDFCDVWREARIMARVSAAASGFVACVTVLELVFHVWGVEAVFFVLFGVVMFLWLIVVE